MSTRLLEALSELEAMRAQLTADTASVQEQQTLMPQQQQQMDHEAQLDEQAASLLLSQLVEAQELCK